MGPEADSELPLPAGSWAARCLNRIPANVGPCRTRQEPPLSLPSARCPMSGPHARKAVTWLGQGRGLCSHTWGYALCRAPGKALYLETGALTSFPQGWGTLYLCPACTPPQASLPVVQIVLDSSGPWHYIVTSLSCPLGYLNFNVGNYVLAKNNILIKCPLEPNHSGAITLQRKRQEVKI